MDSISKVRKCIVCGNATRRQLLRLPLNNKLKMQWVKNIKTVVGESKIDRHAAVCLKHFEAKWFKPFSMKFTLRPLTKNAVPTLLQEGQYAIYNATNNAVPKVSSSTVEYKTYPVDKVLYDKIMERTKDLAINLYDCMKLKTTLPHHNKPQAKDLESANMEVEKSDAEPTERVQMGSRSGPENDIALLDNEVAKNMSQLEILDYFMAQVMDKDSKKMENLSNKRKLTENVSQVPVETSENNGINYMASTSRAETNTPDLQGESNDSEEGGVSTKRAKTLHNGSGEETRKNEEPSTTEGDSTEGSNVESETDNERVQWDAETLHSAEESVQNTLNADSHACENEPQHVVEESVEVRQEVDPENMDIDEEVHQNNFEVFEDEDPNGAIRQDLHDENMENDEEMHQNNFEDEDPNGANRQDLHNENMDNGEEMDQNNLDVAEDEHPSGAGGDFDDDESLDSDDEERLRELMDDADEVENNPSPGPSPPSSEKVKPPNSVPIQQFGCPCCLNSFPTQFEMWTHFFSDHPRRFTWTNFLSVEPLQFAMQGLVDRNITREHWRTFEHIVEAYQQLRFPDYDFDPTLRATAYRLFHLVDYFYRASCSEQ